MKPIIHGLTHDHMDGCRSNLLLIEGLYQAASEKFPFISHSAMTDYFRKNTTTNLVSCFDILIRVMQSETALRAVASTYIQHRANQGYIYLEPKFAPQYHTLGGLSIEKVADIVFDELRKTAYQYDIKVRPTICIGREAGPEIGIEIAKVALKYDGEMILDLVCGEPGNPPEKHLPAYQLTFGTKVRRECHAGEWVEAEPRENYSQRLLANVRTALFSLRCHGIGHAIPLAQDTELVKYVVDEGVRISMCPLSNMTLKHIKSLFDLRLHTLLDANVWLTLNPDDDLFLPEMKQVIEECNQIYSFTPTQCRSLETNSLRPL